MHSILMPLRPAIDTPALPSGMRASVVRLRYQGERCRSEPEVGFLVTQAVRDLRGMAFYARSEALLYRSEDRSKGSVGATLFDPAILEWDARGVFLQGWEVVSDGDKPSTQRVQIWHITPCP